MKTKPFPNAGMLFSATIIAILLFASCQKDISNAPPQRIASTDAATTLKVAAMQNDAAVATDWYHLQLRFLLEKNSSLPNGVYFGYIGIGLYEAVRNGIPNAKSFSQKLYQMPAMPEVEKDKSYNWQASANAAMASLVRYFYSGISTADMASIDSLENVYNQQAGDTTSEEFMRSQSYGRSIATAIHNWFLTDDFNPSNAGYVPPVFTGAWVPTPPAYVPVPVLPYVGSARTYLAPDMHGVAPPFPASYSEDKNSAYYKIAKEVYDVSKNLTTDQQNTALYWVDQGDGIAYTPAGHDMYLTTEAIEQTNAHLGKAAEAYAKAGMAEREATIICFRSKYKYTLERPVTYIRKVIDTAWMSYIPTPPHPEYPAAHAVVTGSVMQAISGVLGYRTSLTDQAYTFRGWAPRTYATIFGAAQEAGISRLYGGIHYHVSINTGLIMARIIGTRIGELNLYK